jgi:hypothetical protein
MKIQKMLLERQKKLKLEGYDVIPHLPARTIVNKNDLENGKGTAEPRTRKLTRERPER